MAATVGSLNVDLSLVTARFKAGLSDAQKQLAGFQKRMDGLGSKMQSVGAGLSVGLTAPLAALGVASMKAATESQQAIAQVNAALASMGPVAGRTSDQLQGLAGKLQDMSNFDDDDILKSVTANLLTFGKISGDAFDRAQLAAVNLSARLGQDLQSSAIQVGKALNDPVKGVTALSRVGVSFTADQKAMIASMVETGNVAGAQGIILGELEKQFGGAAEAQRKATPTADAQQAWRTFQETVGAIALKVLPPLTSALTSALNAFNQLDPATQSFIVVTGGIVAAVGPVIGTLGTLVKGLSAIAPVALAAGRALMALAVAGGPLTLIVGAATAAYLVWKNWDKIGPIVGRMVTAVKSWLVDKLGGIFNWVEGKVKAVGDWFYKLYDRVVGHSYVPDMVDEIGVQMRRLQDELVKPVGKATSDAAQAFRTLQGDVAGILDRLFPDQARMRQFQDDMAKLKASNLSPTVKGQAIDALNSEFYGGKDIVAAAGETWGGFANTLPNNPAPALPEGKGGRSGLEQAVTVMQQLQASFESLGSKAGSVFSDITQIVQSQVVPAAEQAGEAFGSWVDRIQGASNAITGLMQKIFGRKAGGIIGGVLNLGIGMAKAFGGARAMGGPVAGGKAYLVGERGPEIFAPGSSGRIVPNHKLGAAGGTTINVYAQDAVLTSSVRTWVAQGIEQARQNTGQMIGHYDRNKAKLSRRALG